MLSLAPAGTALAQTSDPVTACTVAERPCFTAEQLRQLAKVGDEVMARRVPPDSPVAPVIRKFVDYWVAYSVVVGQTLALSYLPG